VRPQSATFVQFARPKASWGLRNAFGWPRRPFVTRTKPLGSVPLSTFTGTRAPASRHSNSETHSDLGDSEFLRLRATRHTATRSLGQAQEPKNPATQEPSNPTAQQPNNPTEPRKAAKGTRQLGHLQARKDNS